MSTPLRESLLRFIGELRAAGVRISVAESIDAMSAVAASGLGRKQMREALAATLVKDEADRPLFDEKFEGWFGGTHPETGASRHTRGAQIGVHGRGGASGGLAPPLAPPPQEPTPASVTKLSFEPTEPAPLSERDSERPPSGRSESAESQIIEESPSAGAETSAGPPNDVASREATRAIEQISPGIAAHRLAQVRTIERTPFSQFTDLEYEAARDTLAILKRRFRLRLGRRLKTARKGRIDFRRTLRAATQHGGALIDLRFRSRRPRHFDLLVLADVSGSVRYAAALMLELVAGARECFRSVRTLVYIDHLAEADFEHGHLVTTPVLDLYARSDFGRVLAEVWERRSALLNRATVVVIMGDGRNNRRPARADLLRDIARIARTVIWLNPEPSELWGTGDSAIRQYCREVDALLECGDLRKLEQNFIKLA